ncbi:LytTR family DNA-binding domain-containing protein [Lentilactobacillus kisonensis]|uniref:LytTr DNA-binding domain protein n=2 Tax=Lentilactobacillus kisonensis TaxID=481722 RepID=H1LH60_9LACO|nr:LytTR family DNA-binding domain-containing protein [Lentilactobacillus kisonensis]EHO50565.1 LytTr DNA-binding domain protein [Lentilactobacillus kisonensis F0435]KRL20558.1 LytTr DNA-binding domain protein [Lentilactobacillus kisonensis DSM 19906 = JCM 15041]
MKIHFQKNEQLAADEINITLSAADKSLKVDELIAYLKNFDLMPPTIIPIKSADQVILVKPQDIELIDVSGSTLLIYTNQKVIETKGRLYAFVDKLKNPNFVQVSKHAVINIDHLKSLEDSFAGGMTAFLTGNVKTSVSRKYLSLLEQRLGL